MFQWVEQAPHLHLSIQLVSIIFLVLLFKLNRSKPTNLNLPPSPPRLPIIGNLHQLSSLPHRSLQSLARKHGPLMMIYFGNKPILVVSSANAAKELMKTQDLIFSSRPTTSTEEILPSKTTVAFAPYGDYWRYVRKMCVMQLLSVARVESFRSVREEEVHLMINKIRQSSPSPVNLSDLIISFTNDVICRIALGRKFDGRFWMLIQEFLFLTGAFNVGDCIPWLAWLNRFNGINARKKKNNKDLDTFYQSVIEEHIRPSKTRDNGGGEVVEDFVDVLLGVEKDGSLGIPFGKPNIKAITLDMFIAGTDTSSATLVWAMTELIRHPEIMKEVQTEIREIGKGKPYITEDDLGQTHNMKMVIKETLQLHVPAPLLLPRASTKDTKLQGYDIPANTGVMVNAWAIARDPIAWEEPEEFRPRRFLNTPNDYKGQDFNSIPFGAGRRGCPGIHLATQNMDLPLANLLYHFDWTAEDVGIGESSGVVSHRNPPLLAVATPHSF